VEFHLLAPILRLKRRTLDRNRRGRLSASYPCISISMLPRPVIRSKGRDNVREVVIIWPPPRDQFACFYSWIMSQCCPPFPRASYSDCFVLQGDCKYAYVK
jgi:hypothetical protein